MSVVLQSKMAHYFVGLSTDAKPTDSTVAAGAQFYESDTGNTFEWTGTQWVALQAPLQTGLGPLFRQQISLLRELLTEISKIRLGLITATDAVCTDIEGDFTPQTICED